MCRQPLDLYDVRPRWQTAYLSVNGWHFNEKACMYAISLMRKKNLSTGKLEQLPNLGKEEVDELLKRNGVSLENNVGFDYVYIANKCRYDFLRSSVPDEKHQALYVKDVIDDVDAADGTIMREWFAKMVGSGIPVPWKLFMDDE